MGVALVSRCARVARCVFLLVSMPFFGCVGGGGTEQGSGAAQGSLRGGELALSDSVLDLGRLRVGERVERLLLVRNVGDDTLRVDVERPSCACLSVRPMRLSLLAGEEGLLRVQLHTGGLHGEELQLVRLFSSGVRREWLVYVLASVESEFEFELVNQ